MTTAVQNSSTIHFIQNMVLEPYLEGAERINRAISGVNLHHIQHPKINLLTRAWLLFTGIALLAPLVNCVIWIFMRTFGNPEILHEPFNAPFSTDFAEPQAEESQVLLEELPRLSPLDEYSDVRAVRYKDAWNGKTLDAVWTFHSQEDLHHVTREDGENHSETTFDKDWNQKTLYYKSNEPNVEILIARKGNALSIKGTIDHKPINDQLELNPKYPWIQQATTGFRPFIRSNKRELIFYGMDPKDLILRETVATKTEEELDDYGKVTKLTFTLSGWAMKALLGTIGEAWFDSETGEMIQLKYCLNFAGYVFAEGQSNLVRHN